jgi:hypothetical protein
MTAIDELLYLHPASVVTRLAAEPPRPRRKRTEKPKYVAPARRLLLKLARWAGARSRAWQPGKAAAGQAAS